ARELEVEFEVSVAGELVNESGVDGIIDTLDQRIADAAPFLACRPDQTMERGDKFSFLSRLSRELRDTNDFLLCFFGHCFVLLLRKSPLSRERVNKLGISPLPHGRGTVAAC